jgi:hypothetical protein
MLNFDPWNSEKLKKHSLEPRQFIDFRQSTLPNGMRIIEAYNGSGLTFTVLPDRGLDIWTAHYNGIPLTWISQGSPHAPDFGMLWKQQFNGGLLTTCGLTHVGPPENDDLTGEWRDIHGLYSRLRAYNVGVTGEDDNLTLNLSGTVSENVLFGEQLRLTRNIRITLGKPQIEISDTVANMGDEPSPLMILYHCNLGYPLISNHTRLHTADQGVYPRDDAARPGYLTWPDYAAAVPRYAEQVFYHHVKHAGKDDAGRELSAAALLQERWGLKFEWDTRTLPYLCQWKNTREGIYISGIEPGNCVPEGRNASRQNNRLVMLEPGQQHDFFLRLTVLDGAEAVENMKQQVSQLQSSGSPVAACRLDDYAR